MSRVPRSIGLVGIFLGFLFGMVVFAHRMRGFDFRETLYLTTIEIILTIVIVVFWTLQWRITFPRGSIPYGAGSGEMQYGGYSMADGSDVGILKGLQRSLLSMSSGWLATVGLTIAAFGIEFSNYPIIAAVLFLLHLVTCFGAVLPDYHFYLFARYQTQQKDVDTLRTWVFCCSAALTVGSYFLFIVLLR